MFTNTKAVIEFAAKTGLYIDQTLADHKVTLGEAMGFAGTLIQVPGMLPKFQAMPAELKDLTNEGKAEIIKWAEDQLQFSSQKTERIIESLLGVSVHTVALLEAIKS